MIFNPKRILVIDLDELREDEDFRVAWTANIAMAVKDEFQYFQIKRVPGPGNRHYRFGDAEMHIVANAGAEKFIDLLTHKHIKSL